VLDSNGVTTETFCRSNDAAGAGLATANAALAAVGATGKKKEETASSV